MRTPEVWPFLKILFHPFKTQRLIDSNSSAISDLESRLRDALHSLSEQENENKALKTEIDQLSLTLKSRQEEISSLKAEMAKWKEDVEEARRLEAQLLEFDRKLSMFEEMKRKYEKRINYLESRLLEARASLAKKGNHDLLDFIDMNGETLPENSDSNRNSLSVPPENHKTNHPKSENNPSSREEDNDWLMSLPDDI